MLEEEFIGQNSVRSSPLTQSNLLFLFIYLFILNHGISPKAEEMIEFSSKRNSLES
jgi:hypothetical protein